MISACGNILKNEVLDAVRQPAGAVSEKKRLAGRNPEVFSRGSGAVHLKIRQKRTVSDKVCPILSNFVHKKWQKQFEKT